MGVMVPPCRCHGGLLGSRAPLCAHWSRCSASAVGAPGRPPGSGAALGRPWFPFLLFCPLGGGGVPPPPPGAGPRPRPSRPPPPPPPPPAIPPHTPPRAAPPPSPRHYFDLY